MASRRIANNNGSQDALLNSVKATASKPNFSGLSGKEKALAENIVNNILGSYKNRETYENELTSISINAILGRVASLLDEVKDNFTSNELADVKDSIIDAVNAKLENLPKNNATIDIEQITSKIVDKIQLMQEQLIKKLTSSLTTFINDNVVKKLDTKNESPRPTTQTENTSETEDYSNDIQNLTTVLDNFVKFTQFSILEIDTVLLNISEQVGKVINKIDVVLEKANILTPSNKDKKEQKKEKSTQSAINKLIVRMAEQINEIAKFTANFIDFVVNNFKTILDRSFNVLTKFWIKLMMAVILPTLVILGAALYILAGPLMKILQPIMDFVDSLVTKILVFLAPIRDFLIDVLKRIFTAIEPALIGFFKGLASYAEEIGKGLGLFVKSVLGVLTKLMDGIAAGAYDLGKALVKFATEVVNVLSLFIQGIGTYAKAIGEGLGLFVTIVLDVLCKLMEGFGAQAKEIGVAIGKVVLAVVNVVVLLVQFLEEVVGVLVAIVGTIRDFFSGIRTKAKEIGEAIGEFVLESAKILVSLVKTVSDIGRVIDLYIVAPIKAFKAQIETAATLMAGGKWPLKGIGLAILGRDPSAEELEKAQQNKNKSFEDYLKEQQDKMNANFAAADKAAELDKLNQKIQQSKIQQMLDNIQVIDNIFALVKEIHMHLLGEEKTTATISVQAVKPNLDQLNNIQNQDQTAKDNLAQNLNEEKQQFNAAVKKTDEKTGSKQDNFKNTLMTYLDEKFGSVLEKLDNPQLIPIPLQSGFSLNMAGMEDK